MGTTCIDLSSYMERRNTNTTRRARSNIFERDKLNTWIHTRIRLEQEVTYEYKPDATINSMDTRSQRNGANTHDEICDSHRRDSHKEIILDNLNLIKS